jgi:hypothetical protein
MDGKYKPRLTKAMASTVTIESIQKEPFFSGADRIGKID